MKNSSRLLNLAVLGFILGILFGLWGIGTWVFAGLNGEAGSVYADATMKGVFSMASFAFAGVSLAMGFILGRGGS
jgi:hypothetical protein